MDKIKKGLGRGLSSLIGETKVEVQKNIQTHIMENWFLTDISDKRRLIGNSQER